MDYSLGKQTREGVLCCSTFYQNGGSDMRFMVKVIWDVEKGNELARKGNLGKVAQSILEEIKPEAAYFVAEEGNRSAILFVNMDDASQIPAVAEPWFLAVNATVEFQPVMKMEDLLKAGASIEKAVKKFG
jgi:hypothetical protein